MKILLGFFIGMTVCLLLVVTMFHGNFMVSADSKTSSPNNTDISGILPDVGKIYQEALFGPYRQVESEITDPDIARYFRSYMERTGLDQKGTE